MAVDARAMGRLHRSSRFFAVLSGVASQLTFDDALLALALPAAVERSVRGKSCGGIALPKPIAVNEDNPALNPLARNPKLAMRLRNAGTKTRNLRVAQPK